MDRYSEPRLTSEVDRGYGMGFPYDSKLICYFMQDKKTGKLLQVPNYVAEKRETYFKALAGEVKLYATWEGNWSSDLFEVDDLEAYGKAVKAI